MKLSANKAHKLAHVSKRTLLDALETGRLSGEKNSKGHWLIDQSELLRVFPKDRFGHTPSQPKTSDDDTEKPPKSNVLEAQLEAMQTQLEIIKQERERERAQLSDQIVHLRNALDKAQQTTALLTDQRRQKQTWWPW